MRLLAMIMLGVVAMLDSALAYVDARERTTVGVYANAWDNRNSGNGCSPDGCTPDNTRDDDLDDQSRWSCAEELEDETCEICYTFGEPQDIIDLGIAFYQGNSRTRTFRATARNHDDGSTRSYVFTSSGDTSSYEYFYLGTDETDLICCEPVGLDDDEWLSLLEVRIMVL